MSNEAPSFERVAERHEGELNKSEEVEGVGRMYAHDVSEGMSVGEAPGAGDGSQTLGGEQTTQSVASSLCSTCWH